MAKEPNGHNGSGRLNRLERAVEAMFEGHDRLVAAHKQLLTSQILMSDSLTALNKTVDRMAGRVDALAAKVDSHEDRIQVLIDSQLRMDQTQEAIRKLLERRQGQ